MDWLVRLRWGAAIGQMLVIGAAVYGLGVELPIFSLALLVAVTAVSNAALSFLRLRSVDMSTRMVGPMLALDVVVLSLLLHFSGGPSNPFSVMYLVQVTLAALVLGMRWAMAIVALSAVSYAALFFWHTPVAGMDHHAHHHHHQASSAAFSTHLQGMWIAFTIAGALIAYFVARVAAALRAREAELAEAQAQAAKSEKLASLTTLAAGAAHELGTPLATIAIVSKELERTIASNPAEAVADAQLIRAEVDRCQEIVRRMSARAGSTMGELPRSATAEDVFRGVLERLGNDGARGVVVERADPARFTCPLDGTIQVVLDLVQNARWAVRENGGTVRLMGESTPTSVRLVVSDDGIGIPDEILSRIGEPFVTTKGPGEGMGLGLFLARTFAERCGGHFEITSTKGGGTVGCLELPRLQESSRP